MPLPTLYFIESDEKYKLFDLNIISLNSTFPSKLFTQISSLKELASFYVDDILKIQPQGPYWLAGMASRGIIAVEVAKQLQEMKHETKVWLFNVPAPNYIEHINPPINDDSMQAFETFARSANLFFAQDISSFMTFEHPSWLTTLSSLNQMLFTPRLYKALTAYSNTDLSSLTDVTLFMSEKINDRIPHLQLGWQIQEEHVQIIKSTNLLELLEAEELKAAIQKQITSFSLKLQKILVINNTYPKLSFFCHENELGELTKKLDENSKQFTNSSCKKLVITGLPGIGKSTLANKYAHENREKYKIIWEIRDLDKDFFILAKELDSHCGELGIKNLGINENTPASDILKYVKKTLRVLPDSWLLIFDDIQNKAEIEGYLPDSDHPDKSKARHILITSRARFWFEIDTFTLNPLTPENSLLLLEKIIKPKSLSSLSHFSEEERKNAAGLAEQLGHIPAALDEAGIYMKHSAKLQEYMGLLNSRTCELLQKKPHTFLTKLEEVVRKLKQNDKFPKLLIYCALLHQNIPKSWLQNLYNNALKYNSHFSKTLGSFLIEFQEEKNTLNMNVFVQKILINILPLDQQQEAIIDLIVASHLWTKDPVSILHLQSVMRHAERLLGKEHPLFSQILNRLDDPLNNARSNNARSSDDSSSDNKLKKDSKEHKPLHVNFRTSHNITLFKENTPHPKLPYLKFGIGYHADFCNFLIQMTYNKTQCLRVMFSDNNAESFKYQLTNLVILTNLFQSPALFISRGPGYNHFIFGLVRANGRDNQLILIDPLGIRCEYPDFYRSLEELKIAKVLDTIWLSGVSLQHEHHEPLGLVSSGPIVLELVLNILNRFNPVKLYQFWDNLKTAKTGKLLGKLEYLEIHIEELFPLLSDNLNKLRTAFAQNFYQQVICAIRQQQCQTLEELAKEANISIVACLNKYRNTPSQVVFNALITQYKAINNIHELKEYKLLKQELNTVDFDNNNINTSIAQSLGHSISTITDQSSEIIKQSSSANQMEPGL